MGLDAIPTTDLFDAFTKTLCVGYENVPLIFDFIVSRLGTISAPIIDLSGRPVESSPPCPNPILSICIW